ncbi:NAD(P)-binding protein [Biscogniauxia marginata]|nr:NAD(P)-binding protein [Biscogniauxia marginata]
MLTNSATLSQLHTISLQETGCSHDPVKQMASSKTILLVGANRGIGFQLASRFKNLGYKVYGTYRPQTKADPSVDELLAKGIQTFEVDVTNEQSINQAAKDLGDRPLDVLINVAGVYQLWDDKPFTQLFAQDLMDQFQVNVVGPFLTSKAFLPALQRAEAPKIINISSDMASIEDNVGGNACYRISKAGVNQLTKTMSVDLNKLLNTNILTLAVHPGYVATKMTGFYGEDDMETCMSSLVDTIQRFGTPAGNGIPNGGYVRWNAEKMAY